MATVVKKPSDQEIIGLLNSESDSESQKDDKKKFRLKRRTAVNRPHKLDNSETELSETENIFDNVKHSSKKISAQTIPLRIKLRRSTEQSLYKVQMDSERKPLGQTPHKNYSKRLRRNSKDVTDDEDWIDTRPFTKTPVKQQSENHETKPITVEPMKTPKAKSKTTIKCNTLTPSMIKRTSSVQKPLTPLQAARARLHVNAVPKSLPCREEEFNNIFTFLRGKLQDKTGGCIYISGVPGTGKTATVNEVVKCLQKLISKGELDDFNYVAINGMKLTEPRQSYVEILKQLTGQSLAWEQAYRLLEKRFQKKSSKMTLLLVDELDYLCTKRQDVVYNLLDWPSKASAQLVVVTIANTMDLPERVLMGRVTSRLGLTRLTFESYNYKQLQAIVTARLKDFSSFKSDGIQLAARKVSAVSGDVRRALDICRRAMEIAEMRESETILLQDVTEAISEMIATPKIQAIKHCSDMEKIFLQAVLAEVTRTSVEEVYFKSAYRQLEAICSFEGIKLPTVTETLAICNRLGANRILICEHSRNDIYQKILLNISTDDVHYALHTTVTD